MTSCVRAVVHGVTAPSHRLVAALLSILILSTGVVAADVRADPAADALAQLNELSREAEQTTEAMHSAQLSLDAAGAAQDVAERRNVDDLVAVTAARADLTTYQGAVDEVAAAEYMGGPTDGLTGILTANSPQQLIDQLAVKNAMSTEMATTMRRFRESRARADTAERASATSASEARTAAEQASAVRAELQAKQSRLRSQIVAVKARYDALTPDQRAALAALPPPVDAPAPGPEVLAGGEIVPPIDGAPPAEVSAPDAVPPLGGGSGNAAVVQAALTRIGSPYSWGGSGPNAFDCSGLIMWAFQQTGKSLPHSSQSLATGGQPVSRDDLQPGDIVTFYSDVSHAGIYIGDGMMVHASTYGTPVRVAPVDSSPFHNARRY
ncbi:peptidoglycan hydrolase RipC [Mycolicibacterium fluoranthenivorans]|uniref:peptidoglycan hydrolase RipC n=1 Tax=Mycolicibacterium fluoranthenivorans TaxID=258505 RepID=UPI001422C52D|nr:peptidoglycan hydrolase RipC [Mycolicibacterium fluoranthenivorans]MCV7355380.1 C40 family peptidase [Mycolicibacterium fluoranthenivorans]